MANINEFKSQMLGGGARNNQFRVQLSFPSFVTLGPTAGIKSIFLCKAATLPASTIENIQAMYRGRPVNFAGERSFQPWTVSVYNDTDFAIRNALEQWSGGIQDYNSTAGKVTPLSYQADLAILQLDRNGTVIKEYHFADAYPTVIGQIQLDFEGGREIETFEVEFTYNYFTTPTIGKDNSQLGTPVGATPL